MPDLSDEIARIEAEMRGDFSRVIPILGEEAEVIQGTSMADLLNQCLDRKLQMTTMPEIALARVEADLDSDDGRFLWRYNWMTSSNLGRLHVPGHLAGADRGVFTHINVFGSDADRITAYQRPLRGGGFDIHPNEAERILEMRDDHDVIVVPFDEIRASPRGVISLTDAYNGGNGHTVVRGSLANNRELIRHYITKYIKVMRMGPFTPGEIGIWFSEGAEANTMRPLEIGDSGIGFYNRNMVNKLYRAIAFRTDG